MDDELIDDSELIALFEEQVTQDMYVNQDDRGRAMAC